MSAARSQTASAGPHRWSYRVYLVSERATRSLGRRFEVRSPKNELVATCKTKRSDPHLVFFADDGEKQELFRLDPTTVRLFDRAYDVIDGLSGRPFAQIRKKMYKPLDKTEWFLYNVDNELIGMVTETAPQSGFLRRILPVDRFLPKAWALHWGQSICGIIQPRLGVVGEKLEINLSLDKKQEVDRRLAIAVAVALRAEGRQHQNGESTKSTT